MRCARPVPRGTDAAPADAVRQPRGAAGRWCQRSHASTTKRTIVQHCPGAVWRGGAAGGDLADSNDGQRAVAGPVPDPERGDHARRAVDDAGNLPRSAALTAGPLPLVVLLLDRATACRQLGAYFVPGRTRGSRTHQCAPGCRFLEDGRLLRRPRFRLRRGRRMDIVPRRRDRLTPNRCGRRQVLLRLRLGRRPRGLLLRRRRGRRLLLHRRGRDLLLGRRRHLFLGERWNWLVLRRR